MKLGEFVSKHGPAIASSIATVGVGATGYFSAKLGMQIESDKANLKSEDKNVRKRAKIRIGLRSIGVVVSAGASIYAIWKSKDLSDKQKAEAVAAALAEGAAAVKVYKEAFDKYRSHVDPEKDEEIMDQMIIEDLPEEIDESEKGTDEEFWTDDYIKSLSGKKADGYWATENDILRAAMYFKDYYYHHTYVTIDVFYNTLRDLGVDIPELEGEHFISWEMSAEREDYQGGCGIDFNWHVYENKNGQTVNTIWFSETDEEIRVDNEKLNEDIGWFLKAKNKQDMLDALARN